MNRAEVVVRGVVKPDEAAPPADWQRYFEGVRAELEASGAPFRSDAEIEAEREAFRSGDERTEEAFRQGR